MKATTLLMTISLAACMLEAGAQVRKEVRKDRAAERSAIREEFINDRKDTHGNQADPAKDVRPTDIHAYHKRVYDRITTLLKTGKLEEADGSKFKKVHTAITKELKFAKDTDNLNKFKINSLRGDLDDLSDAINGAVTDGDTDENRTPILNKKQHRYEELIEFGVRSGRLSNGEASRLTRELEKLAKLEEKAKSNTLTQREREKIHEEMIELERLLKKELRD